MQCIYNQSIGKAPIDHAAEEAHAKQLEKETLYERLIRHKAYHLARLDMIDKLLQQLYDNPKYADFLTDLRTYTQDKDTD